MKQFIIECGCDSAISRSFWNDQDNAIKQLDILAETDCGHNCNPENHFLVEIEMEEPEIEGKVFLENEKGFHSELMKPLRKYEIHRN